MFSSWRYQLREARQAYRQGRLDDAARMLSEGDLGKSRPGQQLAATLAAELARRADGYRQGGDRAAAWRVLENAENLLGEDESLTNVRRALIEDQLQRVEAALEADDLTAAHYQLQTLRRRSPANERLRRLQLVVQRLESAGNLSERGKFADAQMQLAAAAELQPELKTIDRRRNECREKLEQSRELTESLHRCLAEHDWSKAATLAEELLQLAPQSSLARDARRKAWAHAEKQSAQCHPGDSTHYWSTHSDGGLATCLSEVQEVTNRGSDARFLLWVDAVGGYMVCPAQEVTLGQAVPHAGVDVPLVGDLARRHAKIRRGGEGYVLEPLAEVLIDGKPIDQPTLLADRDEFQLGRSVRLRFRKPHPLSETARLEFVSRNRTQPWADAVLLLAESCVLGPNWHNHVVCRDWPSDVVLYRDGEQLACRAMEQIEIDGRLCDGQGPITTNSRVAGLEFTMSLEEI